MRSFRSLLLVFLSCTTFAAAASAKEISVGGQTITIDPKYLSPTPEEQALAAPFKAQLDAWMAATKNAKAPLRQIRLWDKNAEDAKTPQEKQQCLQQLAAAKASTDPSYQAYLQADQALTAAIVQSLSSLDQRQRLLNPLMLSYVHVVPYIAQRENSVPSDAGALDDYRATYEKKRTQSASGAGATFLQWPGGQDPTFDELNQFLYSMERREGFIPGFFHSIAWRETGGDPTTGAENADERGMFQVQWTDYQPEFGVLLGEPAGTLWGQFPAYCKWVPFNAALALHAYERLLKQAEEYGFTGNDRYEMAYRFYNESSGYILFCQHRLRMYRQLFGLSPSDLPDNSIPLLNRFNYFTQDELRQMYDWKMPDGQVAGDALWNAWKNAKIEITSDLVWKVLQRRLIEQKQYYVLSMDQDGKRWCTVDLTEQNVKRRGQVGILGLQMAAIGICSARGVVPTAEMFSAYFYKDLSPQTAQVAAVPTPVVPQPPAPTPPPLTPGMTAGTQPEGMIAMAQSSATPDPAATPATDATPATAAPLAVLTPAPVEVAAVSSTPAVDMTPAPAPAITPAAVVGTPFASDTLTPASAPALNATPTPVSNVPWNGNASSAPAAPATTPMGQPRPRLKITPLPAIPSAGSYQSDRSNQSITATMPASAPTSAPTAAAAAAATQPAPHYRVVQNASEGAVEALPAGPMVPTR